MKFCVSLILLLAANGCRAIFPYPYMSFGLQRPQQQQFFYHPPQRSFPQQQFFQNYEPPRYPQPHAAPQNYLAYPQIYSQPQNYPYNFYNAPQPLPRDYFAPAFADPYEHLVQYYQRQNFPNYAMRKPQIHQGPIFRDIIRDCEETNDKQSQAEKASTEPETATATVFEAVRRKFTNSESTTVSGKPVTLQEAILGEATTKSTNFNFEMTTTKSVTPREAEEATKKSTNTEIEKTTTKSVTPPEAASEEAIAKSSEPKITSTELDGIPREESTNSKRKISRNSKSYH